MPSVKVDYAWHANVQVSAQHLAAGSYVVRLEMNGRNYPQRVVKQ